MFNTKHISQADPCCRGPTSLPVGDISTNRCLWNHLKGALWLLVSSIYMSLFRSLVYRPLDLHLYGNRESPMCCQGNQKVKCLLFFVWGTECSIISTSGSVINSADLFVCVIWLEAVGYLAPSEEPLEDPVHLAISSATALPILSFRYATLCRSVFSSNHS